MTILEDVKNGIGLLDLSNIGFDPELLIIINSTASALSQIGIEEFDIQIDEETAWPTLPTQELTNFCKQYFPICVKLDFDSSASETITKALEKRKLVLEGRISLISEEQAAATP